MVVAVVLAEKAVKGMAASEVVAMVEAFHTVQDSTDRNSGTCFDS